MDICDEIRIAWAEWVLRYKTDPVVVVLPTNEYMAFAALVDDKTTVCPVGFTRTRHFNGMEVVSCRGEDILFASK